MEMRSVGLMLLLMVSLTPSLAGAQQAESPSLTGDPVIDAWVRKTFGQPDTASAAVTDAVRLAWNRTLEFLR